MELKNDTNPIKNEPHATKSVGRNIFETAKLFEWGKVIHGLGEIWGRGFLIALLIGFIISIALAFFGVLPDFLISGKYKGAVEEKPGVKPAHIELSSEDNLQDWLQPYTYWLEKEADDLKGKGLIKEYLVCSFVSDELPAAPQFEWVLKSSPDFELYGFAFRMAKDGTFQRLEIGKDNPSSVHFLIKGAKKGDKLLAILRISWKQMLTPGTCKDMIRSIVM